MFKVYTAVREIEHCLTKWTNIPVVRLILVIRSNILNYVTISQVTKGKMVCLETTSMYMIATDLNILVIKCRICKQSTWKIILAGNGLKEPECCMIYLESFCMKPEDQVVNGK